MKIQPLIRPTTFPRVLPGAGSSTSTRALGRSFTDQFLSAVARGRAHQTPPSQMTAFFSAEMTQVVPTSTPLFQDPLPPVEEAQVACTPVPLAQSSPATGETDSSSPSPAPSAPQTEMFPSTWTETVPPGYMPALIPHLSVNSETGAAEIRLQPATTVDEYTWLYMLDGVPLPSMLEQIQRQAEKLGVSLADTPLTIVSTDLPPPFAGKSLEELSQMVLPLSFYSSNPNGPYGGVGGALPFTPEQRAEAFALIDDYVIDLGSPVT